MAYRWSAVVSGCMCFSMPRFLMTEAGPQAVVQKLALAMVCRCFSTSPATTQVNPSNQPYGVGRAYLPHREVLHFE